MKATQPSNSAESRDNEIIEMDLTDLGDVHGGAFGALPRERPPRGGTKEIEKIRTEFDWAASQSVFSLLQSLRRDRT